jgi:flavodoxin
MKPLIVFYSRTGTTRKVAESIKKILKCDAEEILDVKSRAGLLGYLRSGKEATLKKLAEIKPAKKNPSLYDLVIIGTPVWAFNMSSPVRTYVSKNKGKFNKVAFFCTMGGSGDKNTFGEMAKLCGKKPAALLSLKTNEVLDGKYSKGAKVFASKIMGR